MQRLRVEGLDALLQTSDGGDNDAGAVNASASEVGILRVSHVHSQGRQSPSLLKNQSQVQQEVGIALHYPQNHPILASIENSQKNFLQPCKDNCSRWSWIFKISRALYPTIYMRSVAVKDKWSPEKKQTYMGIPTLEALRSQLPTFFSFLLPMTPSITGWGTKMEWNALAGLIS